jgi:hypothetical protein
MSRLRFVSPAVILCAVGFFASRCNAWNSTGHEVVAQVAYDQLSPATKSVIVKALREHPRLHQDLLSDEVRAKDDDLAIFLRAATWPDFVRFPAYPLTHTENHPIWHYVDLPFEMDGVKGPQPDMQWDGHSDPANLAQAMQKALAGLKDPHTPADRKAIDICWVEHLVGDIHQPLHATSWFSKEFPEGDKGGNMVEIRPANNQPINLHSYWDGDEGMSMDPAQIRKTADRIEAEHPASEFKDQVKNLSLPDWVKESYELAKDVVYMNGTLPHATKDQATSKPSIVPPLPEGYEKRALATCDQRVALAGYRLAALLEEVAKDLPQ